MLSPMYFLIGIWGGPRRTYAAIKFFLYTLAGSVFMLLAFLWLHLDSAPTLLVSGAPAEHTFSLPELARVAWADTGLTLFGLDAVKVVWVWLFLAFAIKIPMVPLGRVSEVVFVGVTCTLVGFGSKISAAPFHMWTPDVDEGAPTPITALLSVGPKAAGFAGMVRFFSDALGAEGDHLRGTAIVTPWPAVAGGLAAATMTVGNLSALGHDDVKRLLAYSSVAHAGYMLLGVSVFSEAGIAAIVVYVITSGVMNLGAFLVVIAAAALGGGDTSLRAFAGLGRRAPWLAARMVVFLASLAGLPPLAGFVGKFHLFAALLRAGGALRWALAAVGLFNSVIALF